MGEDGDEDSDVAFAFRCAGAESIASPPFAQNAKDGPPATGSGGVALAVGQTLSAAGSVATGFLQVTAAITDNSGIANASTVASVFTGFSGPIRLAASGGNVEAAAMASTLEGFFTFGLSGAVSPVGVGSIADLVSSSADFLAPAQTPAGCQ